MLIACSIPAFAKDIPLSETELKKLISGKTIISNGAKLNYSADGSYTYDGRYPGKWTVLGNRICIDFNNGQSRCDRVVKDGNRYFLIDGAGKRFPFGH